MQFAAAGRTGGGSCFSLVLLILLAVLAAPFRAGGATGPGGRGSLVPVEPLPAETAAPGESAVVLDHRLLPWPTLRRLLLEGGQFPPPYFPLTRGEVAALLAAAGQAENRALGDLREQSELVRLRRGGWSPGREPGRRPPRAGETAASPGEANGLDVHLRGSVSYGELGDIWEDEAGLSAPAGSYATLEPALAFWRGRYWLVVTPRLRGRLAGCGRFLPSSLNYSGWPLASGRTVVGDARRDAGRWRVDWPQLAAGAALGNWHLTVGLVPSRCGPGDTGGLVLDATGRPFPSVIVRRTAPFRWRGLARHVAPRHLLLRVGVLSGQDVTYRNALSSESRHDEPWFLQWLLTFRHTSWLRTTFTTATVALPRHGTLWPDLWQLNFPLLGATRSETRRGPLTDRIFGLQFEARYRDAPWPLLPAAAGRLYWEYAGEDFIPNKLLPFLPEISAPASVIGWELVCPRWDLGAEFAELEHPQVLWYAHGIFQNGYTHRGWVLGHPLGGTGRAVVGWLRWRPRRTRWETTLRYRHDRWGTVNMTPGEAERSIWTVAVQQTVTSVRWRLEAEWIREDVTPAATPELSSPPRDRQDWVRLRLILDI